MTHRFKWLVLAAFVIGMAAAWYFAHPTPWGPSPPSETALAALPPEPLTLAQEKTADLTPPPPLADVAPPPLITPPDVTLTSAPETPAPAPPELPLLMPPPPDTAKPQAEATLESPRPSIVPPPPELKPDPGVRETALQFTNNPHVSLQYEVVKVGSSGVEMVELWLTKDKGRTWRRFAEDPDRASPFVVELPGEGVYGLTLIVRSRSGLGKPAPRSGDLPELRLEVDTTPPLAQLFAPEAEPKDEERLILLWQANDRNLTVNPITLEWAEHEDGPWQTIASDLPNTGRYSWSKPAELPYQVYLRMEARDRAGNVGVAETPKPVLVDLTQPEAKLHGVAGPQKP